MQSMLQLGAVVPSVGEQRAPALGARDSPHSPRSQASVHLHRSITDFLYFILYGIHERCRLIAPVVSTFKISIVTSVVFVLKKFMSSKEK